MSVLPNRYLLLKEEELEQLSKYQLFKVKAVKRSGILIAFTDLCFFIKGDHQGIKKGDTLTINKGMLIPKEQPLYV